MRSKKMTGKKRLSRRALLRGTLAGAGVSLALPPLEAMFGSPLALAEAAQANPFFGVVFWANGTTWSNAHGSNPDNYPDIWQPSGVGAGYTPSELLAPLARHHVSVATGLMPKTEIPPLPAGQGDAHFRGYAVALTGDRPRAQGFDHGSHTMTCRRPTLDQLVARHPNFYPSRPRFRVLPVKVSDNLFHRHGHWTTASFTGPDQPVPPIARPTELYDLVFGAAPDPAQTGRDTAALDAVLADANALKNRLGTRDRQRLNAHLEHVYEIQSEMSAVRTACAEPSRPGVLSPLLNGSLHDKTRLMARLLAVAVNCGLTRVVSFVLSTPATNHVYDNLEVGGSAVNNSMHFTCHDGQWDAIKAITIHHMEAFAIFLDEFAALAQPDGTTLLDRGIVYGTSEYGSGYHHSAAEMPFILAGGGAGKLRRGVHVREEQGNISRGQLTILQALGLPFDRFGFSGGETNQPFSELLI